MPRLTAQSRKKITKAPLARYVNYFEVSHNAVEFLLDFGQYQPEVEAVAVHSRMAFGPTHAKLLARVLHNALTQFEAEHGAINDHSETDDPLGVIYESLPDFAGRAAVLRHTDGLGQDCPSPSPSHFNRKR